MKNQEAMKFFESLTQEGKNNPNVVKLAHNTDYTGIDANFILNYCNPDTRILDIATGTGLIVNKVYDKVGYIECVEPYEQFTKFIVKSDNINIVNKSVFDYETNQHFDLITLFGFMQYVGENEAKIVYKKCYDYLQKSGTIIVKQQFGINEDVNVSGYSQEQKTDYYSQYRHIDKEIRMLRETGFDNIKKVDIYPPEASRWDNTHFWAIVGNKKTR